MNHNSPELDKQKITRDQAHQLADAARDKNRLQGYQQMKEGAMLIALRQLLKDSKSHSPPTPDQS
jgi:hypothetical protein